MELYGESKVAETVNIQNSSGNDNITDNNVINNNIINFKPIKNEAYEKVFYFSMWLGNGALR